MERVLQEANAAGTALDEVHVAGRLVQAAPDATTITADERRGAFAEITASRLSRTPAREHRVGLCVHSFLGISSGTDVAFISPGGYRPRVRNVRR
jgi:hypothetical protein